MKKLLYIFAIIPFALLAQDIEVKTSKFINQTEISLLMGRTIKGDYINYPYYSSIWPPGVPTVNTEKRNTGSFSIQTFNGWRVLPKTAVGVTLGIDAYQGSLIMPLSAGVRQTIFEKGASKSKIQASLDAGIGTTWLDDSDSENSKKRGGAMINPAVGFIFPTKSGSAFLVNFGYKYQHYSVSKVWSENNFSNESRNIKRFQIRAGFQF